MTSWIDSLVQRLGFSRIGPEPSPSPVTESLQEAERQLGGALPDDYKRFIVAYGDGMLGTDDHRVVAPILDPCPCGQRTRPEVFYGVHQGANYGLLEQLKTHRGRLPRGVVPISEDAGCNQVCLDVAGTFPGSVWIWDHEQRWFTGNLGEVAKELTAAGHDVRTLSVHGLIRGWARLHPERFDRPPDYMGMYRMAPTFADFLRSLEPIPYE